MTQLTPPRGTRGNRTRSWLRFVLVWTTSIVAFACIYLVGGIQLVIVDAVWGACCTIGMESAIRNPSNPARRRKTTPLKSIFGYALLFGIVMVPAVVALFWPGRLASLSLAISIVFSMTAAANLCELLFGRIEKQSYGQPPAD